MKEILKILGVDKLDESKQGEIKQKIEDHISLKVDEKVKTKEEELKNSLTEQYETKFEDYKNDISEKFSDFVDGIIDEEMEIPEKIKEFARKGELYEDVIETLKTRIAIDEGQVDEEVKGLLKESKDEIEKMKTDNDKLVNKNLDLKKDAKDFAANIYLREKCDGLTSDQKEKAMSLLEGVTEQDEIDRKIDIIIESKSDDDKDKLDEDQDPDDKDKLDEDNNVYTLWNSLIKKKY